MRTQRDYSVFVAMPSYDGWYSGGTVDSVYQRGTEKFLLRPEKYNSSLLAKCFNVLWVRGVQSGCRWFAMIHADVNAPPLWIDTMVGDMDRLKITFLSASIRLKNETGETSTAMGVAGTALPSHRLTWEEIEKLPDTFTGYDVRKTLGYDGDLLVNSGLWMADLDAPWVKKVWFEMRSSIDWSGEKPHINQTSEDWELSRMLHSLGVTVMCKKMRTGHLGQKEFCCGESDED